VEKQVTLKDMLPDFLAFLAPIAVGGWVLTYSFNWLLLFLIVFLFLLGFLGNAIVRGTLACRHCKQKTLGCPADRLFGGKKNR